MSEFTDLLTGGSVPFTITKKIGEKTESFQAMFNPEQYSESLGINYHSAKSKGELLKRGIQNLKNPTHTFDLLIDGTGASGQLVDVASAIEQFKKVTIKENLPGKKKTTDGSKLTLSWGPLQLKCIFLSASINYTLFSRTGLPLRAKINCQFEAVPDTNNSNLSTKEGMLRRGIGKGYNWASMTALVYGNARDLAKVAGVNGLKSFRDIDPDRHYLFPPKTEL